MELPTEGILYSCDGENVDGERRSRDEEELEVDIDDVSNHVRVNWRL